MTRPPSSAVLGGGGGCRFFSPSPPMGGAAPYECSPHHVAPAPWRLTHNVLYGKREQRLSKYPRGV